MSVPQVLLPTPVHFGHLPHLYSPPLYSSNHEYYATPQLYEQSYFDTFAEIQSSSSLPQFPPSISRSRTTSRASLRSTRTTPTRERTPIRHFRISEPRSRSGSRSEALLAYATGQQQQEQYQHEMTVLPILRSQSAPDTPSMYLPPALLADVTSADYQSQTLYYPTTGMSQAQAPYFGATTGFINDFTPSSLYTSTPNVSHHVLPRRTGLDESDGFYPQHVFSINSTPVPSLSSDYTGLPEAVMPLVSTPLVQSSRVLAARPKPQCWEHGCNGRQFSTFSNLLRHQREKSGAATKVLCPYCGTEFTRTTARNGHLYGGKCKGIPDEDGNKP